MHCNWWITLVTAVSRQWLTGHQHSKSGQQEWPANHSKWCIAYLWWQQTTANGALPICGDSKPQQMVPSAQQESSADHHKGTSANFNDEWAWRKCMPASQKISMAEVQWAEQLVSSTQQVARVLYSSPWTTDILTCKDTMGYLSSSGG